GIMVGFFFSSRRRHTSFSRDWSSDVCSSDLELAGGVITLSGPLTSTRNYPAVAYSASAGVWLATWQEWNAGEARYDIIARAVRADGSLETPFAIYSGDDDAMLPDLAANESGGFLAVWEQTTSSNSVIYARRAISTAVAGATIVLTSTTDVQVAPAVTYNSDDDEYLVVWQDLAGSNDSIWARRVTGITATNPFIGSAFKVDNNTASAQAPAVTYFSSGSAISGTYLVAWERLVGSSNALAAQRILT